MNWKIIYVTGRSGFHQEVRKKLDHSALKFMPGYDYASQLESHDLYWIDEKSDMRDFKEAIGSKIVWKYRLTFYTMEEFLETQHNKNEELTEEEIALIEEMRELDSHVSAA